MQFLQEIRARAVSGNNYLAWLTNLPELSLVIARNSLIIQLASWPVAQFPYLKENKE